MDPGRADPAVDDRHGLHGLLAGLGTDELLGGDGDHQSVLIARFGGAGARHAARAVDLGRLLGGRSHAEPALFPALSLPLHHRRRRGPAHLGAAYPGQQQSHRHRREDGEGHRAVPSLLHDQGWLRAGRLHLPVRGCGVLRAELSRPSGQLHPGQPAADAAAYRAGMVFPAVLRDLARDPEQAAGRDRAAVVDQRPLLRAVARHLEGSLDQLPADLQMVLLGRSRSRASRSAISARSSPRACISSWGASSPSTISPSSCW